MKVKICKQWFELLYIKLVRSTSAEIYRFQNELTFRILTIEMERKRVSPINLALTLKEELFYYSQSIPHYVGLKKGYNKIPVLVNGSPKTGTTWMFKLIQSLPGYSSAEGYNFRGQVEPYRRVTPGQVVHGHDEYDIEIWEALSARKFKVLLMIRDPRDQTVSRMFHIRRDPNLRYQLKMQNMGNDEALLACIEGRPDGLAGIERMIKLTRSWLRQGDKCLPVKYEDLVANSDLTFKRALRYLNISISDSLVQRIVTRNKFERLSRKPWFTPRLPGQPNADSHFRKGIIGDWKNHFSEKHVKRFKELAGDASIDWKYEENDEW